MICDPSFALPTTVEPFSRTWQGVAELMPADDHETVTMLPFATLVGCATICATGTPFLPADMPVCVAVVPLVVSPDDVFWVGCVYVVGCAYVGCV